MATFAEIDENNIVINIIKVRDEDCFDENGIETESIGVAYCHSLFGGRWKKTSVNANFRKNYAVIGGKYDSVRDAFIEPKPLASWILDEETCKWKPPIPEPAPVPNCIWNWNEDKRKWDLLK